MRVLDSARPQDGLDELADIERGDQLPLALLEEREVREEADSIDVELARAGLRANAATLSVPAWLIIIPGLMPPAPLMMPATRRL